MKKPIVYFVILFTLFTSFNFVFIQDDWQVYTYEKGGFSLKLPAAPEIKKKATSTIVKTQYQRTVYQVTFNNEEKSFIKKYHTKYLDQMMNAIAQQMEAKGAKKEEVSEEKLMLAGFEMREARFRLDNSLTVLHRIVFTEKQKYHFMFIHKDSFIDEVILDKFFEGFSLMGEKKEDVTEK